MVQQLSVAVMQGRCPAAVARLTRGSELTVLVVAYSVGGLLSTAIAAEVGGVCIPYRLCRGSRRSTRLPLHQGQVPLYNATASVLDWYMYRHGIAVLALVSVAGLSSI